MTTAFLEVYSMQPRILSSSPAAQFGEKLADLAEPAQPIKKKKPPGMPLLATGLAGAGALSTGLAYGMANDKQIGNVRNAIKNYDPQAFITGQFPEGHTGLTYYEKTLSPAAQLTPFGVPAGAVLSGIRAPIAKLRPPGVSEKTWQSILTNVPGANTAHKTITQFLENQQNKIVPPGYVFKTPAEQMGVGGMAHYNMFANGPVAAYAHQIKARLSDTPVPDAISGTQGARYSDWMGRKFEDFVAQRTGQRINPFEFTPKFMANDDQVKLMEDFYKSLPKEQQDFRQATENPGEAYAKQTNNYLPKAKGFADARDKLKDVGITSLGAGAGGAMGHYLARNSKEKNPLAYWASVLGGTGLGGAASYLGGTDSGRQRLAQIIQTLRPQTA